MKKTRWGLLGAGNLLERWMKGFRQVEDAEIAAVASRTPETARRMADRFGIREALTYEEILKRDDIDIMYIPVPHSAHKELALRALEAGFPVLVEKPAAVSAAEWAEMTACAKEHKVFLMEAMWTRFFPVMQQVLDVIRSGEIGEVRHIEATFAYRVPDSYQGRLTVPAQAGGALLDVGVYGLHFVSFVYEKTPERILSLASIDTDRLHLQVDEQSVVIGRYDDGALFTVTSAIRTDMPDTAWIYGTEGSIRMPVFWKPESAFISRGGSERQIMSQVPQQVPGILDEGYQYEIRHVNDCLRRGLTESPLVTHAMTGHVLQMCDEIRAQWGLVYPFEKRSP
ncbi:MAG: Gfo/Idh/MocA family oxidoreductase [Oscillospiraceae bacterium]|nr:Gfo/Idh/MocA family oxidoreductase [Oscillospiraceae bacterium]